MMYKVLGKWTVTTGMVMSLNGLGLDATQITDFDYADSPAKGMKYIRRRYQKRSQSADVFETNVDVPHEQAIAQNALRINPNAFENRVPTVDDLITSINMQGSLVVVQFDAVIADENKSRFIEVTEAQAEEIKKNPKDHSISAGKAIKRPTKTVKPVENVLLPTIDQIDILK